MIDEVVLELDDEAQPMAETCRRVARRAGELGLTRPSLVHLRTLVRAERDRKAAERARREALREIASDAASKTVAGLVPNPEEIVARLAEVGAT